MTKSHTNYKDISKIWEDAFKNTAYIVIDVEYVLFPVANLKIHRDFNNKPKCRSVKTTFPPPFKCKGYHV